LDIVKAVKAIELIFLFKTIKRDFHLNRYNNTSRPEKRELHMKLSIAKEEPEPEPEPEPRSSQMRVRYIVGLSIVAAFVFFGYLWIWYSTAQQQQDSRVVNIAGRQRMLSQRISKIILEIPKSDSDEVTSQLFEELRNTYNLWNISHDALRFGNAEMEIPPTEERAILGLYADIDSHFKKMTGALKPILDTAKKKGWVGVDPLDVAQAEEVILRHEGLFLEAMDEIVFAHDAHAKGKVVAVLRIESGFIVLIMGVLVMVGFLVFEPSARLIRQQFEEISVVAAQRRRLIENLEVAMAKVKLLHGMLPICASCKKIRSDGGYWMQIEDYIEKNSEAEFTHSICPGCEEELYPRPGH
jgi:Type IV pili methyl-accepting chemotaxis transducer N-term